MLGNFTYCNPTRLHFGENALENLSAELNVYGRKIAFVYGAGSIKETGLYNEIMKILNACQKEVVEIPGVMSNPTLDKLNESVKIARAEKVEFILAVGGGSVIDFAKALSVSVNCEEDVWDKYYINQLPVDCDIIPVGAVLTMTGTGSEMNGGSVITNTEQKLKIGRVFDYNVFPKFAILNPKFTYTVSDYQMRAGIFDIMSHILEQYLSGTDDSTSDYVMEGLLKSLIHSSLIAVKNPEDYEARSNIMWIASWALNTFVAMGKPTDWMVHMIGQQVGAYTNATHGMTLSAVSLSYYRLILDSGLKRFKRFAQNVWNVNPEGKGDRQIAEEGLKAMEDYMNKMGLAMKISELGVTSDMIPDIAASTIIFTSGYKTLTVEEIEEVLKQSM